MRGNQEERSQTEYYYSTQQHSVDPSFKHNPTSHTGCKHRDRDVQTKLRSSRQELQRCEPGQLRSGKARQVKERLQKPRTQQERRPPAHKPPDVGVLHIQQKPKKASEQHYVPHRVRKRWYHWWRFARIRPRQGGGQSHWMGNIRTALPNRFPTPASTTQTTRRTLAKKKDGESSGY